MTATDLTYPINHSIIKNHENHINQILIHSFSNENALTHILKKKASTLLLITIMFWVIEHITHLICFWVIW